MFPTLFSFKRYGLTLKAIIRGCLRHAERHPWLLAMLIAVIIILTDPALQDSPKQSISPSILGPVSSRTEASASPLSLVNRQGTATTAITDGDQVTIRIQLPEVTVRSRAVRFGLASDATVATCTVPAGDRTCVTEAIATRGWYWEEGEPQKQRQIHAYIGDNEVATNSVAIAPRPVVLVHGFLAGPEAAWGAYVGESGFLQSIGLTGYAVGDGQAEGKMSLGNSQFPHRKTHTIAENAEVLQRYIAGVKQLTGAEQVDLLAHSMGGLISRYYIDRLMEERDVAQLLMVASPHGGSNCANLPASLGFFLPATLELRPAYVQNIFNRQITHRHGVPFYLFAGNPILQDFKAPCTGVPSDMVVERSSVATLGSPELELPYVHTAMNRSDQVFREFVEPRLKHQPDEFPQAPDLPLEPSATDTLQFTKLFTGHVEQQGSKALTIQLNDVSVASFSMFDPTRSLAVEVRGATGKVIPLNFDDHGLVQVDDPSSLIYLGYGFKNPKPGAWVVTLLPTEQTPPEGADFAIAAKVVGSATLQAEATPLSPDLNDPVTLTARLDLADSPMPNARIQANIRYPDGHSETVALTGDTTKTFTWSPNQPGLYGVDVTAESHTLDGSPIARTAFLAFEMQPAARKGGVNLLLITALLGSGLCWGKRRRRSIIGRINALVSRFINHFLPLALP